MHDLIIIGAGPAGLTAGLYAGRFRMKALILEKMVPGGQIILSPTIENFPGFPGGIPTDELVDRLKKQVQEAGVGIETAEVTEISGSFQLEPAVYSVKTPEAAYDTKTVIIAAGARPKRLGAEGEERLTGRGVSYCATCDGPLVRGQDVVVVGAGDRAIEDAILLTGYARKVTVVHRRQELRASAILQEKARANPRINFMLDSVLDQITGQDKVAAVRIRNIKTNSLTEIPCYGVFIFVGIMPNTAFLKNQLQTDELGFIITDQYAGTSRAGIFACGDCSRKNLYQVVNACGEGAEAAFAAHKYLLESK